MATRSIIVDDIDGTEDEVETVTFGLDGKIFEIDLGTDNQVKLREFLEEFVQAARPLGRDGLTRPAKRVRNRKAQAHQLTIEENGELTPYAELPEFDNKVARAWLRANGHEVPSRGVIRGEIVMPYLQSEDFATWQQEKG